MANINKVALLNNGKVVGAGRNKDNSNLAPIEATTTASRSYLVGDYLMLQGEFYKVISAISIGDTLTVGTNIQATNVGDEIVDVKDALKGEDLTDITNWGENSTYPSGTALPTGTWVWIAHKVLPAGLYYISCMTNLISDSSTAVSLYQRIRDLTHDKILVSDSFATPQRYTQTSCIVALTETTDVYIDVYCGGSSSVYGRDFHAVKLF